MAEPSRSKLHLRLTVDVVYDKADLAGMVGDLQGNLSYIMERAYADGAYTHDLDATVDTQSVRVEEINDNHRTEWSQ